MPTITYSHVDSLEIQLDYDLPSHVTSGSLGVVIYLHGGGIITGSRKDAFFPDSMKESVLKNGAIFMGADYRLLYPSTGFDVIDDMKALFSFLSNPNFSEDHLPSGISLDASRIALVGASGGAYPAMAAGLYAQPKPKALLLLFGMGGDMLGDSWVAPKSGFMPFPGSESVTEASLSHLLEHPPPPISDAPVKIQPDQTLRDDEGRMGLFMHWWRTGELLDYVVGEPVSATLRSLPPAQRLPAVPAHLRLAILQAHLDAEFPPTCLVHGEQDGLVDPAESKTTYGRLKELGVKTKLVLVPDAIHALMSPTNPAAPAVAAEDAYAEGLSFVFTELLSE
ncbi:Alpha/Beta hydrolase protein [Fomitopsis serialis]|uniref:Alpha/Beta hydrolase protein n=1 Tax=Fomitopsis serialis TaxID=139415 RepID=UPI0020084A0F|nr:Alpha/Beta hydrolase protein [Neoantrodia serialis]KAH9934356.1 Alpha/Beta hydrolase protein [Neoantrodia serialis]